ncbi:MAG: hypothetical protein KBA54_00015 [Candidatus Cloacimonetes bacterium]|nr:hypothetical protein [Candidatus Cloacimonadota bacterium]
MRRALNCLLACLAVMGLTSCKFLFKSPRLEQVHDVKIVSIDPDKIRLELSLSVLNPNRYKLKLNGMDIELLNKNREQIGTATLSRAVEIPGRKANALDFEITLDTRPTVRMVNYSDQKVFVYIAGTGTGKVLGTAQKFSFEEPYEIDIRDQLQKVLSTFKADGEDIFKVKRSYLGKVGLTETQVLVDFIVMNPYGLKFVLDDFPATITIGNSETGSGNLSKALSFDEKVFSREGTMLFKVNNLKAIYNIARGAINGEVSYRVDGQVKINAYGIEFQKPYAYKDLITISITDDIIKLLAP